MRSTSFLETQTILKALSFTLNKGGFGANKEQKRAANALVKRMKSTKSVSGRHQQLIGMLKTGASLAQMMKATASSRRTIFRYLNHFEEAGLDIVLAGGKYKLK